jgi:site-specific DNA recombinase
MTKIRCAIYTRKSSEEGLDQAFNSLDAQREACAAYILSQASEGWTALPIIYDDGGLSGGTLERPALKRLLADVAAGGIDIIVVYKVDRLTRSLFDFAKLVETFDKAGTSFVSVTQAFNTTTSMGRLTLNMLLSFAQFEREVTAERIRDKIAASKAKGMWMGGTPPLGYRPHERTLAIVDDHAAIIRKIFQLYLERGCVRHLVDALHAQGIHVPKRIRVNGTGYGGGRWSRGQVYAILKNPVYIGQIHHRGQLFEGRHPALLDRDLWDQVQARLADKTRGRRRSRSMTDMSVLAGKIHDDTGEPLIAAHTSKAGRRYRYYVSRALHHQDHSQTGRGLRLPAREVEAAVAGRISEALRDPFGLISDFATLAPDAVALAMTLVKQLADRLDLGEHALLTTLVADLTLTPKMILIRLSPTALSAALGILGKITTVTELECDAKRARCGGAVRLVQSDGRAAATRTPDARTIRLIVKARRWWQRLVDERMTVSQLADEEAIGAAYVTRVMRLAFLAPDIVDGIANGTAPPWLDGTKLLATGAVAMDWRVQRKSLTHVNTSMRHRNNVAYESQFGGLVSVTKQAMRS